jgi:hypothetical protein
MHRAAAPEMLYICPVFRPSPAEEAALRSRHGRGGSLRDLPRGWRRKIPVRDTLLLQRGYLSGCRGAQGPQGDWRQSQWLQVLFVLSRRLLLSI